MVRRIAAALLVALVLYGAAPAVLEVAHAWPQAKQIHWWWWVVMVALEAGSTWCLWRLQVVCLGLRHMTPVATSQLASGGLGRVVPGGAATAAAAQYSMLGADGVGREAIVLGLAAGSVVQLAALTAMPVLVLPLVAFGLHIPDKLVPALLAGAVLFVLMFVLAVFVVRQDATLRGAARIARWLLRKLHRGGDDIDTLPDRVVDQRDAMIHQLGRRWYEALAAAVGRWLLDYFALAAALAAVGDHTRLSLVLLAYVGAQLLGQIPITPGGLGIVEAGLTGMLAAAGVSAAAAAVATLAYRLVSYWLMLPAALAAWVVHRVSRRRSHPAGVNPDHPRQT
jgi:putative heme transporter